MGSNPTSGTIQHSHSGLRHVVLWSIACGAATSPGSAGTRQRLTLEGSPETGIGPVWKAG